MENIAYILFICLVAPMLFMVLMLPRPFPIACGVYAPWRFCIAFRIGTEYDPAEPMRRRYALCFNYGHSRNRRDRKSDPNTVLCRHFFRQPRPRHADRICNGRRICHV